MNKKYKIYKIIDIHIEDGFYSSRDILIGNKILVDENSIIKRSNSDYISCYFRFFRVDKCDKKIMSMNASLLLKLKNSKKKMRKWKYISLAIMTTRANVMCVENIAN